MWISRSLNRRPAPWVLRYGLAISSVAVALLFTLALRNPNIRSSLFFPAILVSAWYGGLWAGLAAAGLAYLAINFFLVPSGQSLVSLTVDDTVYLLVFAVSAVLVAWLTATQRRADAEVVRQASLLDLTHDTVFVRDQNDVITYWNHGAAELYGWSKEEAIGRVTHELLKTVFPVPLAEIDAALQRAGHWEGELVHTKRDGSRVSVASRWSLQRDDDGLATGVLETNNDITERKAAEEAFRRQAMLLADAQRLSRTGSFSRNLSTGDVLWSDETYRIYELDPTTIPTLEVVTALVHPDDIDVIKNAVERSSHDPGNVELQYRLVMPDGRIKFIHAIAHTQSDGSGGQEFTGAAMDVTELRQSEEQQKRAAEALRQAHAELAHVTRVTMLGEITASIAHEVNQPLAAVVMNGNACLRWLATDPPNVGEAREAAQRVVSDGNRAGQVIARVRTLLKRELSERRLVDVNELIAETLAFTRTDVARNNVFTRTELRENLPAVMGDRVQLQQVLVNLILNATDAMSEVSDRRRVMTVRSRGEDAARVLVEVQDCGKGLAAGQSDRIFDAFFSTKPGGLGMGLSVSRSIVELHGGKISAASNEGPGVTLTVSLPATSGAE